MVGMTSFKTDPDEKGTERILVADLEVEVLGFKTDPDEKGTERTGMHWYPTSRSSQFQD